MRDIMPIMKILDKVVPIMNESGNFQWDSSYPNEEVFINDISKEQLWVAEINECVAGFAALTKDQEPEYKNVGWDINKVAIVTHRLAVDPQFSGFGVGAALLAQAEILAKEQDISFLRIDTNSMNKVTTILFPKCGYQFCGEINLAFRPGLTFYCYQKILK